MATRQKSKLSASEKERLLKELQEIEDRTQWISQHQKIGSYNNPKVYPFKQNLKQLEFHSLPHKTRLYLGGNRAGKTVSGIVDDIIQALDRSFLEEVAPHLLPFKRFDPPFRCRIVATDFKQGIEQVIVPALRIWAPTYELIGDSFDKAYSNHDKRLRFENGSEFELMTYEQDLSKFGGTSRHRIHYDEEPPKEIRNECLLRILDTDGDEIFTMTPLLGMSWIYDLWTDRDNLENVGFVQASIWDNPFVSNKAKKRILSDPSFSAEERRARETGQFVHFWGMIYTNDLKDHHWVDPIEEVPKEWNVLVGIDPGIRNKMAALWMMVDHHGAMTCFHELYEKDKTIEEFARMIHEVNVHYRIGENNEPDWIIDREIPRELSSLSLKEIALLPLETLKKYLSDKDAKDLQMELRGAFFRPYAYIIDPAARNRNPQTGRSDQDEFNRRFIHARPGQNPIRAGIHRVKALLQRNELFFTKDLENLDWEFKRYRWKRMKKADERDPREVPVDKDNHLLDALRYLCMFIPPEGGLPDDEVEPPVRSRAGMERRNESISRHMSLLHV